MTKPLKQIIRDLTNLCLKRGHSPEESEDLAHDTWEATQIYGKDHKVDKPEAFMTTTAINKSANAYRRTARFTAVPIRDSEEDSDEGDIVLPDPGHTPEEIYSAEQRLEQYDALLREKLGNLKCDVFFYQRADHTYREVAAEFDITERTVQEYIRQAMAVLINHRAGEQE
jgi:RNA polymerase sigma factor (sigma-70 family)